MKYVLSYLLVLLTSSQAYSGILRTNSIHKCTQKPTVIAVIDTGFGFGSHTEGAKLCDVGHRDFTTDQIFSWEYGTKDPVPKDYEGHGTNVAGLIQKYASLGHKDFCIVILKFYSEKNLFDNAQSAIEAIQYSTKIHADFLNLSEGGNDISQNEIFAIKKFLDQGGKIVAAAGNNGQDLKAQPYYPAQDDDRIVVVGNLRIPGIPSPSSNYGSRVNRWEVGENAMGFGIVLSGTSQATAIAAGKLAAEEKMFCPLK